MTIQQEENHTIVTTDNVVIDIGRTHNGDRVFVNVYPYSDKKSASWFINDENGKNVYYKEIRNQVKA